MARAIVRWSVEGERSNATGNDITRILVGFDAQRVGTAAYEMDDDPDTVLEVMRQVLKILKDAPGGGSLDHVWIYVDNSA